MQPADNCVHIGNCEAKAEVGAGGGGGGGLEESLLVLVVLLLST